MASATGPLLKLTTMAIASNTTLFTTKPSSPFLSFPSKPIKFLLSSTFSSSLSLTKKISSSSLTPQVATSDYPQQEEEVEVEGVDLEAEESEGEEGGEESYPEPPEEAKLFVGNLPYDIDSEKLAQLFDEAGVVEISEVIYNRETEQSRGFGFVTMSTVEQAEKAVEMFNRYEVNGRSLTVNKAAPRGSRAERPPRTIDSALRVYVGNLPWQVDDAQLEQVFSEYGKVVDSKVVFDRETGRSRGFGFVTMSSQSEVNDAIAGLDGQSMEGRSIRVNVAEDRPRRTSY